MFPPLLGRYTCVVRFTQSKATKHLSCGGLPSRQLTQLKSDKLRDCRNRAFIDTGSMLLLSGGFLWIFQQHPFFKLANKLASILHSRSLLFFCEHLHGRLFGRICDSPPILFTEVLLDIFTRGCFLMIILFPETSIILLKRRGSCGICMFHPSAPSLVGRGSEVGIKVALKTAPSEFSSPPDLNSTPHILF